MSTMPKVETEDPKQPTPPLRPPRFIGATDLPDRPQYAGGIPIRALEGNLQCIITPWGVMSVGDASRLFWHNLVTEVARKDIQFDHEVDQDVVLWIPRGEVLDGDATPVFYDVKRGTQTPERSVPLQTYLVKTTRPGGYDNDNEDGHSGLRYTILTDISEGVDAEIAARGVEMRIEPYQYMTAYDRIVCRWGDQTVTHYPVTQAEVDDPLNNEIIIIFTEGVIIAAGDGDRIMVTYQVIDCVGNRPDERAPWAKITYVEVDVNLNRLEPPYILVDDDVVETIDLDDLGDDDVVVQVYFSIGDFVVNDTIELTWTGTPAQGSPIIVGPLEHTVTRVPSHRDFIISNAAVKAIAGGFAKAAYVRIRAGETDLPSKSASVNVRGDLGRLPAPSVAQAPGGNLPADAPYATISVPYYEGRNPGDLITIHCLGRRPDSSETYHPISIIVSNEPVGAPIERGLPGSHISPLDGGTLKIYYTVANDDELGIRSERESDPLQLRVGVAQGEFLAPDVAQAEGDVLLPENAPIGADITARFNDPVFDTRDGDTVGLRWVGSISGAHPPYEIPLTSHTAGKPVPFFVDSRYIGPNRDGTVETDYYLLRTGEPLRFSRKRVLSIGVAQPDRDPPTVRQAPNDTTLDPMAAKDALTVVIPGTLPPDALLSVTWSGAAGEGSYTSEAKPVREIGQIIDIPVSVVAYNLGKPVTVNYSVSEGGAPAKQSKPLDLNVQRIPDEHRDLPEPRISRNQGNELDVTQLVATDTLEIDRWPFPAVGQCVWLTLSCPGADGSNTPLVIWNGQAHNYEPGISLRLQSYLDWLKGRRDGATLSITFKVNLDKVANEATAVKFPVRAYTVRAVALENPSITSVKGSPSNVEIPDNTATFETSLKFSGKASANKQIELLDGGTPKALIDVDESGDWEHALTSEPSGVHSYTVKALYGTLPESDARTLKIIHYTIEVIHGMSEADGLTVNKNSTRLYVNSAHNIYVIDTTTNTLINTVTAADLIFRIAVSPDDRKIYVSTTEHQGIDIIDIATNTRTNSIPAPGATQLLLSPDGARIYAGSENGIYVIDTTREAIITTIDEGSPRNRMALTPDGARLCCTYPSNNVPYELAVLNTLNSQITRIPLPFKFAWNLATTNTHIYVLTEDGNVAAIDFSSSIIVANFSIELASRIAANPDGSFIHVNINSRDLATIETATYRIVNNIARIGDGYQVANIAVAPDNVHIYTSHLDSSSISVITLS